MSVVSIITQKVKGRWMKSEVLTYTNGISQAQGGSQTRSWIQKNHGLLLYLDLLARYLKKLSIDFSNDVV